MTNGQNVYTSSRPVHISAETGHQCATESPHRAATNTTHSPDGANSSTGNKANSNASNVYTTNEHAKQGNETHTMAESVELIITLIGIFLFSFMFGFALSKRS